MDIRQRHSRSTVKPFAAFLFFVWVCLFGSTAVAIDRPVDLVILHVNDTHGRLFDRDDENKVGRIARFSTLVTDIRNENPGRTLLLHAGDDFSRADIPVIYSGGEISIRLMHTMGCDAFTPGNGDFYFGLENLLDVTRQARFPIVSANLFLRKTGKLIFAPYTIKDVAGVKVAILGLGFVKTEHPSCWTVDFRDPVEIARQYAPELRKKADLVIALTHIGVEEDQRLASQVPDIDIIIGGHSHTVLETPISISRPGGSGCVRVVQAGEYYKFLGRLDLHFIPGPTGKATLDRFRGCLIKVGKPIKPDKSIKTIIREYDDRISEVICTSKVTLSNPPSGPNPLGELLTGAVMQAIAADVVLLDRDSVKSAIAPGPIAIRNVYQTLPFRNPIIMLNLTGEQLEQAIRGTDVLARGVSFTRVGKEIADVKAGSVPIDRKKTYTVAVDNWMLWLCPALRSAPQKDTGKRVDTVLEAYLRKVKVVDRIP